MGSYGFIRVYRVKRSRGLGFLGFVDQGGVKKDQNADA